MLNLIIFYSLAVIVVGSALCVVALGNVLHCALCLGLCLAGVAGIYGCLGADFVFGAQILVYVGGVAVLMLFVVLLSGRASDLVLRQVNEQWMAALLLCGIIIWSFHRIFSHLAGEALAAPAEPVTLSLGRLLLQDLVVPFELVSLLLLAALVGAVVFSKEDVS